MANKSLVQVDLCDVLKEAPAIGVEVRLWTHGTDDDGIIINDAKHDQRVVIENHSGELHVHVYATRESIDNAPTHMIVVEDV